METPPPPPSPAAYDPLASYSPPPPPPRMAWRTAMGIGGVITLIGSVVVIFLCIVGNFFMSQMMSLGGSMMGEMDMMGAFSVIDDYMVAMYYGDAHRAHGYLSDELGQQITEQDLEVEIAS